MKKKLDIASAEILEYFSESGLQVLETVLH